MVCSAASMVVQKVKGLLYRLLKVPAADLRLTYTSPKVTHAYNQHKFHYSTWIFSDERVK